MENRELSNAEWLDKAEAYCARSEHCAADVRRKLFEWGAPADIAAFIEEKLYDNYFLNDARFCRAYVHDKVEYQSWGRLKIQAGLRALQLPESEIRQALADIDESKYISNLRALIASRRTDSRTNRNSLDDKTLRFLLQRGFTFDEINQKSTPKGADCR